MFLLLIFNSFLHIWVTDPLPHICFANVVSRLWIIFSFSYRCLSHSRSFDFNKAELNKCFHPQIILSVLYLKPITKPKTMCAFSFVFFWKFHRIAFHCWVSNPFCINFVNGVRCVSTFIFLCMNIPLFHHHLSKRRIFLQQIASALLSKISWLCFCGSISGCCSVPLICTSVPSPVSCSLDFQSS